MSNMVQNGSSRGADALPPDESHPEFLALCALATTGSLTADEQTRLREHLSGCAACREAMAQYQALIGRVVPAMAPEPTSARTAEESSSWSIEEAEASLFARLAQEESEAKPEPDPFFQPRPSQVVSRSNDDALWRHMWWQYAAGLVLLTALGFALYRIGMGRGREVAERAGSAATSSLPVRPTSIEKTNSMSGVAAPAANNSDRQIAALRAQIEAQSGEIGQLKKSEGEADREASARSTDFDRLAQERADLVQQLSVANASLADAQQKLSANANQSSTHAVEMAALEARINDLTDSLRARDQEVAREQELLDHDRDIRELMGARDLYIAEVYDVAKTGDTEKPFGRVFYTQGKSLIFYAYDLDQQPGIKNANTFQAWGRRGPDREQAVNLGILFEDNTSKKRWVLKSHDPKTLGQIDAVFVTVEPNGGSSQPSGKPLLFAYLRVGANHP